MLNATAETINQNQPNRLFLGLPPSEKDSYQGPMQKPEYWVLYMAAFWVLLCSLGTVIHFVSSDPFIVELFRPPDWDVLSSRMSKQIPGMVIFGALMGYCVEKFGVNVAITRKTGHILAVFLLPMLMTPTSIAPDELYHSWYLAATWYALSSFIIPYGIMLKIFRDRFKPLYYCHRCYDRPEDRPYTLFWLLSQMLAISLIFLPMTQYFISKDLWSLYLIAAFANGLGDGLAEPIGKIFGKKKYKVRAVFTKRVYERSYVGSACVAFFTAVGIFTNYNILSAGELITLLAILPAAMTLIEAKSPHTWDNFFLLIGCWVIIYWVVLA
jgi:phytol kinase